MTSRKSVMVMTGHKQDRDDPQEGATAIQSTCISSAGNSGDDAWALSLKLFGPPILLPGESKARYRRLFESFAGDLQPRDSVDVMIIRDITDLAFEVEREQRAKAALMMPSTNPVPHLLKAHLGSEPEDIGSARLTSARIKDIALLDHMIAVAQQSKYRLLDFLYRLRAIRAKAVQEAAAEAVVDGEFTELAPTGAAPLLDAA